MVHLEGGLWIAHQEPVFSEMEIAAQQSRTFLARVWSKGLNTRKHMLIGKYLYTFLM